MKPKKTNIKINGKEVDGVKPLEYSDTPRRDLLIYGKVYALWREGEYIGTAVWDDDPNIGESFIHVNDEGNKEVCIPDEWKLVNE